MSTTVYDPASATVKLHAFLNGLSLIQLLSAYNSFAEAPLKAFKDKTTAVARLKAALAALPETKTYSIVVDGRSASVSVVNRQEPAPSPPAAISAPVAQTTAPQAAADAAPVRIVRAPRPADGEVIVVKAEKNPRRPGSLAAERFSKLGTGMTVGEFVRACASVGDRLDKRLARRARRSVLKEAAKGNVEVISAAEWAARQGAPTVSSLANC